MGVPEGLASMVDEFPPIGRGVRAIEVDVLDDPKESYRHHLVVILGIPPVA
jgi:hypothetical protein